MLQQKKTKKVFLHILHGNEYAFADERTRSYLIGCMEKVSRESDWQLYAFCMTNQKVYFVFEAKSLAALNRDLARLIDDFQKVCQQKLPDWWYRAMQIWIGQAKRLGSEQEMKECCCLIHKLPLKYGYVERLSDYWWSSYVTYAGIYERKIVSCEWLLGQFDDRQIHAQQKLREYHKSLEVPFEINNV